MKAESLSLMYGPKLQIRKLIPLVVVLQVGAAEPVGAQEPPAACPGELQILVERSFAERAGLDTESTVWIGNQPAASCRATVAGTFEPPADPASETWQRRTER